MGLGRTLITIGLVLVATGLLVTVVGRFTPLGRLPGDVVFRRGNFTFYFPVVTCVVLSLLITLVMWLMGRR